MVTFTHTATEGNFERGSVQAEIMMGLKEAIIRDIDDLRVDELLIISEQIRLVKSRKRSNIKALPMEDIRVLTSSSKSREAQGGIHEKIPGFVFDDRNRGRFRAQQRSR
jgi:hypothetical protein